MSFKPVDPTKTGLVRELRAEDRVQKLQDGTITLPTRKLYVVDPAKLEAHPEVMDVLRLTGSLAGEIEYPLDFCTMDRGACSQGSGELDGFYHVGGMDTAGNMHPELWIHSCYRPTRKWFTSHVKSLVKFYDNVQLPW